MKRAFRAIGRGLMGAAMGLFCGCVEIYQLVKMNHDGSGEIVESITVLPEIFRLLERQAKEAGRPPEPVAILSEDAQQARLRAYGEVVLKERKQTRLPDGSQRLDSVYSFRDINKVQLWIVPSFNYGKQPQPGRLGFQYAKIVYDRSSQKWYRKDLLSLQFQRHPAQEKFSAPSVLQDFREVTPMFLDMLKDFRFTIEIQAPSDVESFEEWDMVTGMPTVENRVIPYRVSGRDVILNPEIVRGFITGEIGGRSDAYGGDWVAIERSIPNVITPYAAPYHGMSVRFAKVVEVPAPAGR